MTAQPVALTLSDPPPAPNGGDGVSSNMVARDQPLRGGPPSNTQSLQGGANELATDQGGRDVLRTSATEVNFATPAAQDTRGASYIPFGGPGSATSQTTTDLANELLHEALKQQQAELAARIKLLTARLETRTSLSNTAPNSPVPQQSTSKTGLTQAHIWKEIQQTQDEADKFDGLTPSSGSDRTGPPLHEWQPQFLSMARSQGLEDAVLGIDTHPGNMRLASYALMHSMSSRLRKMIFKQPHLTTDPAALWAYLQAVYAPRG